MFTLESEDDPLSRDVVVHPSGGSKQWAGPLCYRVNSPSQRSALHTHTHTHTHTRSHARHRETDSASLPQDTSKVGSGVSPRANGERKDTD